MKAVIMMLLAVSTVAALEGDPCSDDTDCGADETCYLSSYECEAAPPAPAPEPADGSGPPIAPSGFECGMDGYVQLIANFMEVALAGLSILRQIGSSFLPADLRKAVEYAWNGLKGAGSWIGYALVAANYAAEEFEFGEQMCMVMGYVDMALGYAVMGVEFIDTLRDMIPI
jgi:hypothetical protein